MAEYEALLLGIEISKDMGIKLLDIKGDSDLIIQQVKGQFACKCQRLKNIEMQSGIQWNSLMPLT